MGKTKRNRTKVHRQASKVADIEMVVDSSPAERMDVIDALIPRPSIRLPGGDEGSIFPGNVVRQLDPSSAASMYDEFSAKRGMDKEFDARTVITSISLAENRHLTKKEKRKIKHETFMRKIEVIRKRQREAVEKKNRSARPVIGDLNPLKEALPELSPLELLAHDLAADGSPVSRAAAEALKRWTRNETKRPVQSLPRTLKSKAKKHAEDLSVFQAILKNPEYRKDHLGTISTHVQLKVLDHLEDAGGSV